MSKQFNLAGYQADQQQAQSIALQLKLEAQKKLAQVAAQLQAVQKQAAEAAKNARK